MSNLYLLQEYFQNLLPPKEDDESSCGTKDTLPILLEFQLVEDQARRQPGAVQKSPMLQPKAKLGALPKESKKHKKRSKPRRVSGGNSISISSSTSTGTVDFNPNRWESSQIPPAPAAAAATTTTTTSPVSPRESKPRLPVRCPSNESDQLPPGRQGISDYMKEMRERQAGTAVAGGGIGTASSSGARFALPL